METPNAFFQSRQTPGVLVDNLEKRSRDPGTFRRVFRIASLTHAIAQLSWGSEFQVEARGPKPDEASKTYPVVFARMGLAGPLGSVNQKDWINRFVKGMRSRVRILSAAFPANGGFSSRQGIPNHPLISLHFGH